MIPGREVPTFDTKAPALSVAPVIRARPEVEVIRDLRGAAALRGEWADLHRRSGTSNPYTHPVWALAWARQFLRDDEVYLVTVRRAGQLVGLAPLSWVKKVGAVAALHLMGNSRSAQLTEVPGVLSAPGEHRRVFRLLLDHLQGEPDRWDWVKLTLDTTQGWFEPQWLTKTTRWQSPVYLHQATRACVVVDLPTTWEAFLGNLKRNVRESVRRSTNRLDRQAPGWGVEVVTDPAAVPAAIDTVIALHESRTQMVDKPFHPSMFDSDQARQFFRKAVTDMAALGLAEIYLLQVDGQALGGLVVLRSGRSAFASITGADPSAWRFGPGTILLTELFRREIVRGGRSVNLSSGPNQSKLRWSEHIEYNHDFVVVGPRPRSKVVFGGYRLVRALTDLDRAMQWDVKVGSRR